MLLHQRAHRCSQEFVLGVSDNQGAEGAEIYWGGGVPKTSFGVFRA